MKIAYLSVPLASKFGERPQMATPAKPPVEHGSSAEVLATIFYDLRQ